MSKNEAALKKNEAALKEANPKTVWINEAILKTAGIGAADLKAALAARALDRRKRLAFQQTNSLLRSKRRAEQRKLAEKFLPPVLAQTGYDKREFEALRTQAREEAQRAFEQQKSALVSYSPSIGASLRAKFETLRQARSAFGPPYPFLNFVVLDTPALIVPTPGVGFDGAHIEPDNTTVQFDTSWQSPNTQNGVEEVSFLFFWQNPASTNAVVDVESYLALNGFCSAWAWGGDPFSVDTAVIDLYAYLDVLEWWKTPPTSPPAQGLQQAKIGAVVAEASGLLSLGDYVSEAFTGDSSIYDVSYRGFVVPPHATALFEVRFGVVHDIMGGGSLSLDFFGGGRYNIVCPGVVLAILS